MTLLTHGAEKLPRTRALGQMTILAALSTPQRPRAAIIDGRWKADKHRDLLIRTGPMAANVESIDMPASVAAGQVYTGIAQQTLLGRLDVLADVKLHSTFGGYAAGEPLGVIHQPGKPVPLLRLEFSQPNLQPIVASALVAISNDLAEQSEAESGIRDLVLRAATRAADEKFILLALNGTSATGSGATTPYHLTLQVRAMVNALVAAGANASMIVLAANPATLVTLATAPDGFGRPAFPGVTLQGGTLCGVPLVPSSGAAPGTIVAVAGDAVLRAAGSIDIAKSEHAHLEFSNAATGAAEPGQAPVDQSAPRVSLFQANQSAIRIRYTFGCDFVRTVRAAFVEGVTLTNPDVTA